MKLLMKKMMKYLMNMPNRLKVSIVGAYENGGGISMALVLLLL